MAVSLFPFMLQSRKSYRLTAIKALRPEHLLNQQSSVATLRVIVVTDVSQRTRHHRSMFVFSVRGSLWS